MRKDTLKNYYNSIKLLPPYFQKQPLMQDLCFFIDYLGVDIESVYADLRYKYIDWSAVSEESIVQTLKGMGMDYVTDLMEVITPTNGTQLLALCSLIWLLKGQLSGVDILASICGFSYKVEVWWEDKYDEQGHLMPLRTPNTATITLSFKELKKLSENFQFNFVEFLRKYLYPITLVEAYTSTMEGEVISVGVITVQEEISFIEQF